MIRSRLRMTPRGGDPVGLAPSFRFETTTSLGTERGLDRMIANKDGGVSARAVGLPTQRPGSSLSLSHDRLSEAVDATSRWLLDGQNSDGFWVGELEGDTILESEYVLLMAFIGRGADPVCVKACRY